MSKETYYSVKRDLLHLVQRGQSAQLPGAQAHICQPDRRRRENGLENEAVEKVASDGGGGHDAKLASDGLLDGV